MRYWPRHQTFSPVTAIPVLTAVSDKEEIADQTPSLPGLAPTVNTGVAVVLVWSVPEVILTQGQTQLEAYWQPHLDYHPGSILLVLYTLSKCPFSDLCRRSVYYANILHMYEIRVVYYSMFTSETNYEC